MPTLKNIPKAYLFLGFAVLVLLLVWWVEKPASEKPGDRLALPLLADFNAEKVARIEIEHLMDGVQLRKAETGWEVAPMKSGIRKGSEAADLREKQEKNPNFKPPEEEPPQWQAADANQIAFRLDIVGDTRLTSLVGSNKERHGWFETNAAGMQVRLFDAAGNKTAHLFIGKGGPSFTEGFIRHEGEDNVYLADRFLRNTFPPTLDPWLPEKKEEKGKE